MKRIILTIFLMELANLALAQPLDELSETNLCANPRIMGGITKYPYVPASWHATLEIKLRENATTDANEVRNKQGRAGYRVCSAVIVNRRMALTSGHCLKDAEPDGWNMYFNFDGQTPYTEGARRLVTQYRIYEAYTENPIPENDFGVVFFNTPIAFNTSVSKAKLALLNVRTMAPTVWSECQLAGTGEVSINTICTHRPNKHYIPGFVVSSDCCKAAIGNTGGAPFTQDSLCFRSLNGMPCVGDSGADLSCKNPSGERKIIAIHSGGTKCCNNNLVAITPREKRLSPINAQLNRWLLNRIAQFDVTFPHTG